MSRTLSIVVPCYNEQEVLLITHERIEEIGQEAIDQKLCDSFEVVYVDDGSRDNTYAILFGLSKQQNFVRVVRLATNFGHQSAIIAGYTYATGDWICSIDADLQDPPELILDMLRLAADGADIVFAVRNDRTDDSFFKRASAEAFYRLMNRLGAVTIPHHADFRLFTRQIRDVVLQFQERNLFLRGTFAHLGYTTAEIAYKRPKRAAGETKYPFAKMLEFAINGVTSFSIVPLRLCTLFGFISAAGSLMLLAWSLYTKFFIGSVSGWTSIVAPLYFIGGVQMMFLGILGEYVGKIYLEVKNRPRFLVRNFLNISSE